MDKCHSAASSYRYRSDSRVTVRDNDDTVSLASHITLSEDAPGLSLRYGLIGTVNCYIKDVWQ